MTMLDATDIFTTHLDGRRIELLQRVLDRCTLHWGDASTACILWGGPTSGKPGRGRAKGRGHSYPRMSLDGCTVAVHRIVWQTLHGPLPPKKQLDHTCRNRRCVIHCEPVTHKENQKRKVKNG